MRLTIAHKLAIGLAVLSALGLVVMLVVYRGLATVQRAMHHLAELREPASTAAHEMEINLNEIGLAVFKYLDSADAASRLRVPGDEAEFERFRARYLELAQTEAEREFAATLGERFREFGALAQALLARKDEQETAFRIASENFETLDAVIDENQDRWGGRVTQAQSWKLFLSLDMEADLAEVAVWLANYQRTHLSAHRALMQANADEFRSGLRRLKGPPLTKDDQAWTERVETLFDQTMSLVEQIAVADEDIRSQAKRFDALRASMDDLLDEQVQAAAFQGLAAPREETDRATARVVRALQLLIPGFLLAGLAVGVVLLRVITEPLKRLRRGTAAISAGQLSYRVTGLSRDEFGDLADHFNRMVERLEATTVSKERLEASQAELRTTVDDLRKQISERRRAEAEQERLQESLRRSETMSAMGSLVAGVAHEVRNPLFGISSTLDALEARLGPREETRRHLTVLRGEVERLSRLMQDLLNYGRPGGGTHVPEAIAGPVEEAVRTCAALARDGGVRLEQRLGDGGADVAMDRVAMAQVFRNLLENAIQHSPPGGTVSVETSVTQHDGRSWLDCTVSDTGPGFRPDDLARVFEPFYTRRRGGTGLGLSIVQRIVEDHDGWVHASNGSGRGAVVTVSLPLAVRAAQAG